ncbi:hypothetical protein B0T22DRAFT_454923 [Podospora appendiculata]|uniref:Molybdopterin synthase sulfur carrier subunit n=1 Tax=Podospora appendiculata TaxID=314037 RepID=A0AAE0XKY9_9PEZI|nr:hypothetical protein B0T22DRAFT_454923 [Podospora appendiculata]
MTSHAPVKDDGGGGQFTILYFASAGSYTAKQVETLPAPLPLSKLFATLEARYEGIGASVLDHSLVTVNLTYVEMPGDDESEAVIIQDGDEVAIIPPVSSG